MERTTSASGSQQPPGFPLPFPCRRLGSQSNLGSFTKEWEETKVDSSWFPARGNSSCGTWELLLPESPVNPDSLCYVLHAMFPILMLCDILELCFSAEQQMGWGEYTQEVSPELGPNYHRYVSACTNAHDGSGPKGAGRAFEILPEDLSATKGQWHTK